MSEADCEYPLDPKRIYKEPCIINMNNTKSQDNRRKYKWLTVRK